MARYHADNSMAGATYQAISTTLKTQITAHALTATLCRGRVVGIAVGPNGPPSTTDCNVIYTVVRQTAAGTGTAVTAQPLGPDVATRSASFANFTAEPTGTLVVWTRQLNQRSSMQWVGQDTDANLVWPATNVNGFAGQALCVTSSAYTGPVSMGFDYEDL